MSHFRCMGNTVLCNDRTCIQYNKHYCCEGHQLHVGDLIKDSNTNRTGWIYDVNQYGSKRSVLVFWDDLQDNNSGTLVWGHQTCGSLVKIGGPRNSKVSRI